MGQAGALFLNVMTKSQALRALMDPCEQKTEINMLFLGIDLRITPFPMHVAKQGDRRFTSRDITTRD